MTLGSETKIYHKISVIPPTAGKRMELLKKETW